jgi:hypothetical protein
LTLYDEACRLKGRRVMKAKKPPVPESFRAAGEAAKKAGSDKLTMREVVQEIKAMRREKRAKNVPVKTGR